MLLVGIVELGDEEEVSTSDARRFDALSDLTLVPIRSRSINVGIAVLESHLNSLFNSSSLGLPGT